MIPLQLERARLSESELNNFNSYYSKLLQRTLYINRASIYLVPQYTGRLLFSKVLVNQPLFDLLTVILHFVGDLSTYRAVFHHNTTKYYIISQTIWSLMGYLRGYREDGITWTILGFILSIPGFLHIVHFSLSPRGPSYRL